MTEEEKEEKRAAARANYEARKEKRGESLGWYDANRAKKIFKNLKKATIFTQHEVYILAKEFVEWFEFSDGQQQYEKIYGSEEIKEDDSNDST